MGNVKEAIAKRAAQELKGPLIVNLGIGIPTLIPNYVQDKSVFIHTENGMLGVGPYDEDRIDPTIVNSGKAFVTEEIGTSYFDSSESFAMIRGGHVSVTVLGILQIDEHGRIANWAVPGKNIIGVGGAMDLIEGAKKVICTMLHTTKDKQPKILHECTYPLTSTRQIDMLITDLAVFTFEGGKMQLRELMPGATLEQVEQYTEADFINCLAR